MGLSRATLGKVIHPSDAASAQLHLTLCNPMDCSPPGSSVWIFQAIVGMPFHPPEDIPDPGIKPTSPESPALAAEFFFFFKPLSHLGSPTSLPTFHWPELSYMVPLNHKGCWEMALVVKNLPVHTEDTRDAGLIPGSGKPPGGGCGNALQHSCLENAMDRRACPRLQSMGLQRVGHD